MKKYPSTCHFAFSEEVHNDDKVLKPEFLKNFIGVPVIVTEKLDGENSCLKPHVGVFARSHQMPTFNPWADYLKSIYFSVLHLLNPDYWYFGENTYAIHSIEYTEMDNYFYVFGILDTKEKRWLSWDELVAEVERVGLQTVPVLFDGIFESEKELQKFMKNILVSGSVLGGESEGGVARKKESFSFDDFQKYVAKFVRNGHVQTDEHWTKNWQVAKIKKD